eukprot:4061584-Prymnesium_polylepis.1
MASRARASVAAAGARRPRRPRCPSRTAQRWHFDLDSGFMILTVPCGHACGLETCPQWMHSPVRGAASSSSSLRTIVSMGRPAGR